MIDHQARIAAAMLKPEFYPHATNRIRVEETHISRVFLTGEFVYKIKKPVNLDFLDFTTLEKRRHFCRMEVELNRRLTRDIYLGVVAVTVKDQKYCFGGPGQIVEFAVQMRQLPAESSMARRLRAGRLDQQAIEHLARILSGFYEAAPRDQQINDAGSWPTVKTNCEENFAQTEEFAGSLIDRRMYQIIRSVSRAFLQRHRNLFEKRLNENKIREGHGDLRIDHIYFTSDGIQIIDCIEFNQRFRCGDIASDLAFLAMELDFNGRADISRALLEAYAHYSGDREVFVLLDFYKCYRAFVRTKVNCLRIDQGELAPEAQRSLRRRTRRLVELAYGYAVQFTRPTLWVICGLIAAGKSTVAEALANALQIEVIRSDVVRKKLFAPRTSKTHGSGFGEGIYSEEATSITYGKLLRLAQEELDRGRSLILDATFSRKHQRREVQRLARDRDVNLLFVECLCPEAVIRDRLRRRGAAAGTTPGSDARLPHLEAFKSRYERLDEIAGEIRIPVNTEKPLAETIETILARADLSAGSDNS